MNIQRNNLYALLYCPSCCVSNTPALAADVDSNIVLVDFGGLLASVDVTVVTSLRLDFLFFLGNKSLFYLVFDPTSSIIIQQAYCHNITSIKFKIPPKISIFHSSKKYVLTTLPYYSYYFKFGLGC